MGRDGDAARPELTLRARGLAARFGPRVALEAFDLDLAPGAIVGLLGPNGAGKTTALRLLTTGRTPSAGELSLFGTRARRQAATLRRIGIAGDEPIHIDALTGWENAVGFARAAGLARLDAARRVEALFETFGLSDDAHRPVSEYSLGMRRKLLLAEALAPLPSLIVLDEPTGGLDQGARATLVEVLRHRAGDGAAVILATHDLQTAAVLCDRVLFLRAGRTVHQGTPADLIAALGHATRFEFTIAADRPPAIDLPDVAVDLVTPTRLVAHSAAGSALLPTLCEAVLRSGAVITSVLVRRPDLADVYLKATGEELAA